MVNRKNRWSRKKRKGAGKNSASQLSRSRNASKSQVDTDTTAAEDIEIVDEQEPEPEIVEHLRQSQSPRTSFLSNSTICEGLDSWILDISEIEKGPFSPNLPVFEGHGIDNPLSPLSPIWTDTDTPMELLDPDSEDPQTVDTHRRPSFSSNGEDLADIPLTAIEVEPTNPSASDSAEQEPPTMPSSQPAPENSGGIKLPLLSFFEAFKDITIRGCLTGSAFKTFSQVTVSVATNGDTSDIEQEFDPLPQASDEEGSIDSDTSLEVDTDFDFCDSLLWQPWL